MYVTHALQATACRQRSASVTFVTSDFRQHKQTGQRPKYDIPRSGELELLRLRSRKLEARSPWNEKSRAWVAPRWNERKPACS